MSSAVTYDFIDVNEKASFSISAKLFPKRCAFAIKTFFCLSPLTKPGKIALTLMLARKRRKMAKVKIDNKVKT